MRTCVSSCTETSFKIIPTTSIEWAGIGYDMARKDANANLISQGSIMKFLGEPGRVEWTRLNHHEVDTIDGDKTSRSGVTNKAVLPSNLKKNNSKVAVRACESAR